MLIVPGSPWPDPMISLQMGHYWRRRESNPRNVPADTSGFVPAFDVEVAPIVSISLARRPKGRIRRPHKGQITLDPRRTANEISCSERDSSRSVPSGRPQLAGAA